MTSSRALESKGDIARRLHDLERVVQQLRAARRGEHMTVGAGGLDFVQEGAARIYDLDGELVMRIGALGDGAYGIEAFDAAGESVQLSTLAFREEFDEVDTGAFYRHRSTLATWGNLTDSPGPVLEDIMIGSTGRARITVGATINVNPFPEVAGAGFMSVEVSGTSSVAPNSKNAVALISNSTDAIALTASRTFKLEGLSPGPHTFTARYLVQTALGVGFNARQLTVQPF